MRNKYFLFGLFALVSCSQDELVEQQPSPDKEVKGIVMRGEDFRFTKASRSSFTVTGNDAAFKWMEGDTVGIFPMASSQSSVQEIPNEGIQVSFPMTKGIGMNEAQFDGGGWALKNDYSYAAYFPLIPRFNVDKKCIPVDFTNQTFKGKVADAQNPEKHTIDLGKSDFMTAQPVRSKNGNVMFYFKHVGSLVLVNFEMEKAGKLTQISLKEDLAESTPIFSAKGTVNLTQTPQTPEGKPLALPIQSTEADKTAEFTVKVENVETTKDKEMVTVYFMMAPEQLQNKRLALTYTYMPTGTSSEQTGHATIFVTENFIAGDGYNLTAQPTERGHYRVEKPGTLSLIANNQLTPDANNNLTISGKLNGTDLKFLRESVGCPFNVADEGTAKQLSTLDLSNVQLVASNEVYAIKESNGQQQEYRLSSENKIGEYLFAKGSFNKVLFPKNITEIGAEAFANSSLNEITLPATLGHLGNAAFANSNIPTIELPASLETLGDGVFPGTLNCLVVKCAPSLVCNAEGFATNVTTEQCDLVLTSAWKDQVTIDANGNVLFKGKVWKSITDENGKDMIENTLHAGSDPWKPGNGEGENITTD